MRADAYALPANEFSLSRNKEHERALQRIGSLHAACKLQRCDGNEHLRCRKQPRYLRAFEPARGLIHPVGIAWAAGKCFDDGVLLFFAVDAVARFQRELCLIAQHARNIQRLFAILEHRVECSKPIFGFLRKEIIQNGKNDEIEVARCYFCDCFAGDLIPIAYIAGQLFKFVGEACSIRPVSYTHLDV